MLKSNKLLTLLMPDCTDVHYYCGPYSMQQLPLLHGIQWICLWKEEKIRTTSIRLREDTAREIPLRSLYEYDI